MFSFLDVFRSFVRGERGPLEVDATRRVEEQRDYIDARSYLSRGAGTRRPGHRGMRRVLLGVGQGGSIQANIDRWEGQFKTPDGKPAPAKVTKITVHGLPVTTIDVSGEYSGIAGPLATSPDRVTGYRLLGAIVESPGGNVFIKFTGPAKTMAASQPKFRQLLDSFEKAGK